MPASAHPSLPRWLYSATDAQGRPAQGFVSAVSAPDALAELARTRPDLGQVQLRTTGMTVGMETDLVRLLGADRSPAQLSKLARDLVRQQERPGLLTSLVQLVRINAIGLAASALALGWGLTHDWSTGWLVLAGAGLAFPFVYFLLMQRYVGMHLEGLRAHARGDLAALDTQCGRLTRAARRLPHLRQGAWDLAAKRAWHVARRDGLEVARREMAAFPFPQDAKRQVLFDYEMPMAVGDMRGAAQVLREAHQRWPDEPTVQADLALVLARAGEPAEAQRLMAAIPAAQLPPHAEPFRLWINALVALSGPDKTAAIALLMQACGQFLDLGKQTPAAWPALAVCTSDLALALAWSGRTEEARKTLQPVLHMVKVHAEPARLALLRRTLQAAA